MLNPQTGIKFSDYNSLYDILIPQDSKYRQLNELIDFASIRKELVKNYSKNMGREAIDPIILFKYLLLKTMHPVSDRDLIARSRTDMAYKYFLGLRPEDDVIDIGMRFIVTHVCWAALYGTGWIKVFIRYCRMAAGWWRMAVTLVIGLI